MAYSGAGEPDGLAAKANNPEDIVGAAPIISGTAVGQRIVSDAGQRRFVFAPIGKIGSSSSH